jgi:hypothetical protein
MDTEKIKEMLDKHFAWCKGEPTGERAHLEGAHLEGANLERAHLEGAHLEGAHLEGAHLEGANLERANLEGAHLEGAHLERANLPSPMRILEAAWNRLSDSLTRELMRFDAENHPKPDAFTAWAKGGDCPYSGAGIQRCANFKQRKECWKPGKAKSAFELILLLFKEKKIKHTLARRKSTTTR